MENILEDLSAQLAAAIDSELAEQWVENPTVRAWSDDAVANLIEQKINTLSICVLVTLPNVERIEDKIGSDFTLTWQIQIEQNPVTSSGKLLPKASLIALQIFRALDSLTFGGTFSNEYYCTRAKSLKSSRNGMNHIHTITISSIYPIIKL